MALSGLKAIAMNVMGVMGVLNLSYMRGVLRFWMMTSIWFRFVLIHSLFEHFIQKARTVLYSQKVLNYYLHHLLGSL